MASESRGLYVGRFQPFHLGHLYAVRWVLERESLVVVAVGSAQYSHTLSNPFTLGERLEMIWKALREECLLDRALMTGIPDTNDRHDVWVSLVHSRSPGFGRVYSNDPLTRNLLSEAGYEVISIPFYKRNLYSATTIREKMMRGDNWESLVHPRVAEYLREIEAEKRLREVTDPSSSRDS